MTRGMLSNTGICQTLGSGREERIRRGQDPASRMALASSPYLYVFNVFIPTDMVLRAAKAILLHTVLATLSSELTTLDEIIVHRSNCLPTELLLIVRAHLLSVLTTHLFLDSTHALSKYEKDLQRLLCPDCISYNYDIFGPDIWQWQQFSGPCHCAQLPRDKPLRPFINPQQFASPRHWLEHHLSLQIARLSPAPSQTCFVWDVVNEVLHRHHCELVKEDLDDFTPTLGSLPSSSSADVHYYRRAIGFYETMKPRSLPTVRIRPLNSSLRSLENKGIGEVGQVGDTFRGDIILCRASQDLGLSIELTDVFSSPREPPASLPALALPGTDSSDISMHRSTCLLSFYTSPVLHGVLKTYSFLSIVLGAFITMPMTIATLALVIVCFYSRSIALRVGI